MQRKQYCGGQRERNLRQRMHGNSRDLLRECNGQCGSVCSEDRASTQKKNGPVEEPLFCCAMEISPFASCFPWAVHLFVPHGRLRSSDRTLSWHPSKDRYEPHDAPSPSASSRAGRSPAASSSWSSSN